MTTFQANDNQLHTTLFICTQQALEKFSTDCPITDDDKSNEAIYDKKVATPRSILLFLPASDSHKRFSLHLTTTLFPNNFSFWLTASVLLTASHFLTTVGGGLREIYWCSIACGVSQTTLPSQVCSLAVCVRVFVRLCTCTFTIFIDPILQIMFYTLLVIFSSLHFTSLLFLCFKIFESLLALHTSYWIQDRCILSTCILYFHPLNLTWLDAL